MSQPWSILNDGIWHKVYKVRRKGSPNADPMRDTRYFEFETVCGIELRPDKEIRDDRVEHTCEDCDVERL